MLKTKGLAGASRTVVVSVDVPTDKAALEGLISHAENVGATDYTPSSYKKLITMLASARTVYADATAKQSAVDQAEAALENALKKLVKVADVSALKSILAIVNKLDSKLYTSDSWQKLREASTFATETLNGVEPTQESINLATRLLFESQANLVKKEDKKLSKPHYTPKAVRNDRHNYGKMPATGEKNTFVSIVIGLSLLVLVTIMMLKHERKYQSGT